VQEAWFLLLERVAEWLVERYFLKPFLLQLFRPVFSFEIPRRLLLIFPFPFLARLAIYSQKIIINCSALICDFVLVDGICKFMMSVWL